MSSIMVPQMQGQQQHHLQIPSRETLNQMYQKWQLLKSQGATDSNHAEFAHISSILRSISQAQRQGQQQRGHQNAVQGQHHLNHPPQQQPPNSQAPQSTTQPALANQPRAPQGQPNQPGSNGVQQPNGVPANAAPNQNSVTPSPKQAPTISVPDPKTAGPTAGSPVQKSNANPNPAFTQDQYAILRNQILAFKLITKNQTLPAHILSQILHSSSHVKAPPASSAPTSASAPTNGVSVPPPAKAAVASDKAEQLKSGGAAKARSGYDTFTSPYSLFQSSIFYSDHASREKRPLVPSIMPTGLDISKLQEERERIVHNRIMARKAELEKLPSNMAEIDVRNGGLPNDKSKIKALIEYKSICLLQKQRNLRKEMVRNIVHMDNLAMTANRAMFRRMKKQSLREARITESLEKQQRDQREKRERQKHLDYLQSVVNHSRDLLVNSQNKQQKLGRMMMAHHQHMEKEEQKRMERTAKQRLQALKANDEEAYLKLLDQAKDSRITHLLKQTNGFLNSLAQAVRTQQKQSVQMYGRPEGYVSDESEEEDEDDDEEQKVDYYGVAHRIQETVTEQPSLLVGGKLKEYQIKGLQWMVSLYNNNLNGILADEMGLGKTIQTISLVTHLMEKKKVPGPFLVIVPLSTLTNWVLEFEKWAPSVKKIVYKGPPLARKAHQAQVRQGDFQALLTTYEYIIKDRPILSKIKWAYMIVDEGHRMKNAESKLSFTLTTYYQTRFRLILTGTPLQNNLPELWALLNFVLPNIFKSVKSFDEWFNTPFANTGGQDKMELTEEEALLIIRRLHKVLRPFLLRRLKKDVESELPDKVEKVVKCKLSSLQGKLYDQMKKNGQIFVNNDKEKSGRSNIKGLSNMLMQLRKICNHPFVFEDVENAINTTKTNNDLLWRVSGKFELLDRLLPKFFKTGHRVLMFFQMTQIMNIMEDFLLYRGWKYMRLDGSTKADDRSLLLKDFNAPNSPYFVFLLSTRAGGLGLNLQTADTVIIYDSDWNPHQDLQAQDRAHRIGQKNEVRILRLITSNSVEEKILSRAQYKLDIDGKVIQAGKFDNKSTAEERDALLRSLLETDETVEKNEEDEQLDDDELNEIIARNDAELVLFREMDAERELNSEYGENKEKKRLMEDSELPEIYLQEDIGEEPEDTGPVGRGARERTQIRYDDGLTEEQWLDAIDDDQDTPEEAARRKREAKEKRMANKVKKQAATDATDDTPVPVVATPPREPTPEPEPTPSKRKRGRQPQKRKATEDLVVEAPKRKRPRGKANIADVLSPSERDTIQLCLNTLYDHVLNVPDAPDSERKCSEYFVQLPSKKLYADYYTFIKSPISFEIIRKKIEREDYSNLNDAKEDFQLMFNNARTYNEEGSLVYEDANIMEEEFRSKITELAEKHSLAINMDEKAPSGTVSAMAEGDADGESTAPLSDVGTPVAAPIPPNIHLRLKVTPKAQAEAEQNGHDDGESSESEAGGGEENNDDDDEDSD